MREFYRCVVIAVAGWISLAAQNPNMATEPRQSAPVGNASVAYKPAAPVGYEAAERSHRARYEGECLPTHEKRESDLCAQWKAADAAAESARWAATSTWLGGINALLVVGALGLAFHSNWIARDTARRQLRAYISFEKARISDVALGAEVEVTFEFKNAGQTPSFISASATGIEFVEMPITIVPILAPEAKATPSSEGPGSEFSHSIQTKRGVNAQELSEYQAGKRAFVASCEVQYTDIFNCKRRTLVSVYRTNTAPRIANQLSVLSFGNDAT